jgi:hypothetical protein
MATEAPNRELLEDIVELERVDKLVGIMVSDTTLGNSGGIKPDEGCKDIESAGTHCPKKLEPILLLWKEINDSGSCIHLNLASSLRSPCQA